MENFPELHAKATKDRFHVLDLAALADDLFVDLVVVSLALAADAMFWKRALVRHVWPGLNDAGGRGPPPVPESSPRRRPRLRLRHRDPPDGGPPPSVGVVMPADGPW